MSNLVAFDIGTEDLKMATIDQTGRRVSLPFPDGESTSPSNVYFRDGQTAVFGREAQHYGLIDPQNYVRHWKRSLGTSDTLYKDCNGKKYQAKDILELVLGEFHKWAETATGTAVTHSLLSIPANVNDQVKQELLAVAEGLGLEVVKLVHEPTCAIHDKTAGSGQKVSDGYRCAVDVGGGTTDISIELKQGNTHSIVETNGEEKLGGVDYTGRLCEHCVSEFEEAHDVRITQTSHPEDYAELSHRVESAKKLLNKTDKVSVPVFAEGKRLSVTITKDEYRQVTQDLTAKIITCFEKTLTEAGISKDDLAELVVVGGGGQVFCVQDELESHFGRQLSNPSDPCHAVAKGAALIGWEEVGSVVTSEGIHLPAPQLFLRDVTAHAIGVFAIDDQDRERFTVILAKGAAMPSQFTKMFLLSEEGATAADIRLLQGQAGDAPDECSVLGNFQLMELQPMFGQPHKIEICLNIDKNGLLTATARDTVGGKTADLEVSYRN